MTQTVEDIRYQLEEWLAQGFTSPEDQTNYQALKEQYEDETLDYSFSKREIIGQLDIIITTRENDFPDLDEVTKEEYLDLVEQLDDLDKGKADYYRSNRADFACPLPDCEDAWKLICHWFNRIFSFHRSLWNLPLFYRTIPLCGRFNHQWYVELYHFLYHF